MFQPTYGCASISQKESIDQVVSLLENVRLLGSRLTFNYEEFLLFRESEEDGATTITAPNQQQCNQDKNANQPIESASKRQVAFAVSDDCNQAADSQQTTNVALRKVEASSSADEQSFFYRQVAIYFSHLTLFAYSLKWIRKLLAETETFWRFFIDYLQDVFASQYKCKTSSCKFRSTSSYPSKPFASDIISLVNNKT